MEYTTNTHNFYVKYIEGATHNDVHRALINRLKLEGRSDTYDDEKCPDWRINIIMSKGVSMDIAHVFVKCSKMFLVLTGVSPLSTLIATPVKGRRIGHSQTEPVFVCGDSGSLNLPVPGSLRDSLRDSLKDSLKGSSGSISTSGGSWADADMDDMPDANFLADFDNPVVITLPQVAPVPIAPAVVPVIVPPTIEVKPTAEVTAEPTVTSAEGSDGDLSDMLDITIEATGEIVSVPVNPAGVITDIEEEDASNVIVCTRLPQDWDEQRLKSYFKMFVEHPDTLYFRGHNADGSPIHDTHPFIVIQRRKLWKAFIYFDISSHEAQFAILACKRNIPGAFLDLAKKAEVPSLNVPRIRRSTKFEGDSRSGNNDSRSGNGGLRESTDSLKGSLNDSGEWTNISKSFGSPGRSTGGSFSESARSHARSPIKSTDRVSGRFNGNRSNRDSRKPYVSDSDSGKQIVDDAAARVHDLWNPSGKVRSTGSTKGSTTTKKSCQDDTGYAATNKFAMLELLDDGEDVPQSTTGDDNLGSSSSSDEHVETDKQETSGRETGEQQTDQQTGGQEIDFRPLYPLITDNNFLVGPVIVPISLVGSPKVSYANTNRLDGNWDETKKKSKSGKGAKKGGKKGGKKGKGKGKK